MKFFSKEIGKLNNTEGKRYRDDIEKSQIDEIGGQITELEQKEEKMLKDLQDTREEHRRLQETK